MKIKKTQAQALARTLFGGTCNFHGNVSDEPREKCYYFNRGIFSLYIYGDGNIKIFVQEVNVGVIDTSAPPLDFAFQKIRAIKREEQ